MVGWLGGSEGVSKCMRRRFTILLTLASPGLRACGGKYSGSWRTISMLDVIDGAVLRGGGVEGGYLLACLLESRCAR
jgi:hypothetical protein